MTEAELDRECDQLFEMKPIEFMPRKNNVLDMEINKLINEMNIRIPVMHIKDKLYLIGHKRLNAEIRGNDVMLRIGGGYEKFSEHIPHNQRYYERQLVVYMIKSGESLEQIINYLFNDKRVPNLIQDQMNKD
jgi:hypothetical protein